MEWKEEEILILVKVYPSPSKKYGETVCSAGLTRSGKWIRIYPVPYRDLPPSQQFSKFQWIRAQISKAKEKLNRPESYKIDPNSIKLLEKIPAGKQWGEREKYFIPHISKSLEVILENQKKRNISLGAFKPKLVTNFIIERSNNNWDISRQGILNQTSLFHKNRKTLEKIPYQFRYEFRCDDTRCKGHNMVILDWEVFESYRRWKRIYENEKDALAKLKHKWLTYFFGQRETYFVVGTESQFGKFMILTPISPKRKEGQLELGF